MVDGAPSSTGHRAGDGAVLRRLPRRAVAWVLGVEAVAVLLVLGGVGHVPTADDVGLAVLLLALSVVHTELATGIERVRRRVAATSYFDLSSVWTFAAALLLPTPVAALVIAVVYGHLWVRVWHPAGVPLHRHVYTTATVVLAALAAHQVLGAFGGLPAAASDVVAVVGLGAAMVTYVLVNTLLVAIAIGVSGSAGRATLRGLLGQCDDNVLELATLCMGALAALALAAAPGLAVFALPPILVLHRAVLVRHFEAAASTDGKTGLLNAATWQAHTRRALRRGGRSGRAVGVLILDLDHFKAVNDRYGHLAGDQVLAAVAEVLRSSVRDDDVVGRFGGEEFVVLLPGLHPGPRGTDELVDVAERLRRRVAEVGLTVDTAGGPAAVDGVTVSVGAAITPELHGADPDDPARALETLLKASDTALYAAKAGGRDQVRLAPAVPAVAVPSPRRHPPAEFVHRG